MNARSKWIVTAAVALGASTGAALAGYGIYVLRGYTMALFILSPAVIGFVTTAVLRARGPQTAGTCIAVAMIAGSVVSLGFLLIGAEGIACIIMAIPLATPGLALGALAGYLALHRRDLPPVKSAALVVLMAASLMTIEARLPRQPELNIVSDSVVVHAPPSRVWSAIVALDGVPTPDNWMYTAGLACPERTRIESGRPGGQRVCTLSTGQLVEHIEVWKPEHTLRWRSRSTPPPMRETNPFHDNVDPPHLHGYYESPRGEFAIERIGPNLTRLTRRTWFSHRLYPQRYWGYFCELAISQIHRTVLDHVRNMAEEARRPGPTT